MSDAGPRLATAAVKDTPTARPARTFEQSLIDGVEHHEIATINTRNGESVEAWRSSESTRLSSLAQLIHVTLHPGAVTAWHLHRFRHDAVFVTAGHLRLVLFDPRPASPTHGSVEVFDLPAERPALVVIPPGVWHGVQVLGSEPACFVNCFDVEYDHDDPDEWRLPIDSDEVPYRFT